jgi:CubicO group peptidase (beta-lactamase class C family)
VRYASLVLSVLSGFPLAGVASPAAPTTQPTSADAGSIEVNRVVRVADVDGGSDAGFAAAAVDGGSGSTANTVNADEAFATTVAVLKDSLESNSVPGAALAVVVDGKLRFTQAVGVKRLGTNDAVQPTTLFQWASVTKVLTSIAVQRLSERHALSLGAPLSRALPELRLADPYSTDKLTLDQLLHHNSGVPSWNLKTDSSLTGFENDFLPRYLAHNEVTLLTPPGRLFNYSNLGFALLGLALEHATGRAYEDVIHDEVLVPAGMTSATLDASAVANVDHATGYSCNSSGLSQVTPETVWGIHFKRPFGGLQASVVDVAHLAEALLEPGRLLDAKSWERMINDVVPTGETPERSYGRGVFVEPYHGVRVVYHHGAQGGFTSVLMLVPERRFAVVLVTNLATYVPKNVALKAVDAFLGLSGPELAFKTDPSTWRKYRGEFFDPDLMHRFRVRLKGTQLMLDLLDFNYSTELKQTDGDSFTFKLPPRLDGAQRTGTFWLDNKGRAEYFALTNAVGTRGATPTSPTPVATPKPSPTPTATPANATPK